MQLSDLQLPPIPILRNKKNKTKIQNLVGRFAPFYFYKGIGAVRAGEALAAKRGTIRVLLPEELNL